MNENRVLTIDNLTTTFKSHKQKIQAVRGVSLYVKEGDILAIVGESGSGKSVTMKSVMGLLGENAEIQADHLELLKKDLLSMSEKEKEKMRGKDMAMVFQDPMTALNPLKKIGGHMIEVLCRHQKLSKKEARKVAVDMLAKVGISSPESRMEQYPHEFSGGMRQRVMIAMALCCQPRLLIADEPTTALDVTIQAQILQLLKQLNETEYMNIILITHDLGVVASLAKRIEVMYGGLIMEEGTTEEIFENPTHPYTRALLHAIPKCESGCRERLEPIPGMAPSLANPPEGCPFVTRCKFACEECKKEVPLMRSYSETQSSRCIFTKEELDEQEKKGETFGLVGESGCGKSTLGRTLIRMYEPTDGTLSYDGDDITKIKGKELLSYHKRMQIIFQDPYSALDPHQNVREIMAEPISVFEKLSEKEMEQRIVGLLEKVGMKADDMGKYAYEFSGGQRQRIGIARALSVHPEFLLCDEPISALDVSIQAQVVNVLEDLQKELGLTYLFVAHDLSMVRHISDRIGVMYLGKVVESGESDEVYDNPCHPYTQALLKAIPIADPKRALSLEQFGMKGELPSPLHVPSGCRFHTRCPYAMDLCRQQEPELEERIPGHLVACWKK